VSSPERREVVIVGGGPAGAAVAARLAAAGRDVLLLERSATWHWRACGVFASPAAVGELRRAGLPAETIDRVARPIAAMRVEAPGAPPFRLTYGADRPATTTGRDGPSPRGAVGFDRRALDEALLDLARSAGAEIRRGVTVREIGGAGMIGLEDGARPIAARVLVGADGIRSVVARSLEVARPPRLARTGLTYHVRRLQEWGTDARMLLFDGGYCGLAPVPRDLLNVGIVLDPRWRARLRREGARAVVSTIDPTGLEPCDRIEGASPIGHRVTRRAGGGQGTDWLVVGDAAGFLDPFTGEGIHRALVSARFAARAIEARLTGRAGDLSGYERAMRAGFASKDIVSLVVQGFLAQPALFAYAARRLADRAPVRERMGLVMGDLVPASRALEPQFLAALLRP
jgi:flavin-dependent dehydrogenase